MTSASLRHLVFLSQVFYPDIQSNGQLFPGVLVELVRRGCRVDVICGYPVLQAGDARPVKAPRHELYHGVSIHRVGFCFNYKRHLGLRALHYGAYLLGALVKLVQLRGADLIFAVTNPPFTPVFLWLWRWLLGCRYQLMLLDLFPEGLTAMGAWSERHPAVRLWAWANQHAYARAERVWVIGRDMADLVNRRYSLPEAHVGVFPLWGTYDPQLCKPADQTELWRQLNLDGHFVVQYSGNMGLWHDIDTLVRAARLLNQECHIQFLFVGGGKRREPALQLAQELEVTNIRWLPFQPSDQLHDSLSCCHLAVISLRQGLAGIAVPCKLYGILASGRGILALVDPQSEVARVVNEERCGVVLPPDDHELLAAKIRELSRQPELVADMGRRAYQAYVRKYTPAAAVSRFEGLRPAPNTPGI
jgi:colanic acid biosynthesis glycosyl transferase WcaI